MTQIDQHQHLVPAVSLERRRQIRIRDLIVALAHVEDALRLLPPDHPARAQLLLRQETIVGALHRRYKSGAGTSAQGDVQQSGSVTGPSRGAV